MTDRHWRSEHIGEAFYRRRVAMGRGYTVRRFATEVLQGRVSENLLSAIEKGTRFPSEALVRRLASLSGEDPKHLLATLWRDRLLYSFRKELIKVLKAPKGIGGISDGDLAVVISRAISALPEDESWIDRSTWHENFRAAPKRKAGVFDANDDLVGRAEKILLERDLIEQQGSRVRLRNRDYIASDVHEQQALATEFFEIFAKGLLDKLVLGQDGNETYLRNHFIHVDEDRIPQLQAELHQAIADVLSRFETTAGGDSGFLKRPDDSDPIGSQAKMNHSGKQDNWPILLTLLLTTFCACDGGTSGFDPIPLGERAVIQDVRNNGSCQELDGTTYCRANRTAAAATPTPSLAAVTTTPIPTATEPPVAPTPTATTTPVRTVKAMPLTPSIVLEFLGGAISLLCNRSSDRISCELDFLFSAIGFPFEASYRIAARNVQGDDPWTISEAAPLGETGEADDDQDGIPNCFDPCPGDTRNECNDPCARDSDSDGKPDCVDLCPGDPIEADLDGDGQPNCLDPCPVDPADVCSDVCARDSDGDGYSDCDDICPFDPGQMPDMDGDGIPDCMDPCVDSADLTCFSFEDRDGDGLLDFSDSCPDDPENLCFDNCGADFDGDGSPFCVDPCPADPEDNCPNPCAIDSDGDGTTDCEDPCPNFAEFDARMTVDLPLNNSDPEVLVEIAVLAFIGATQDIPTTVDELSETGATFVFVTDLLPIRDQSARVELRTWFASD